MPSPCGFGPLGWSTAQLQSGPMPWYLLPILRMYRFRLYCYMADAVGIEPTSQGFGGPVAAEEHERPHPPAYQPPTTHSCFQWPSEVHFTACLAPSFPWQFSPAYTLAFLPDTAHVSVLAILLLITLYHVFIKKKGHKRDIYSLNIQFFILCIALVRIRLQCLSV